LTNTSLILTMATIFELVSMSNAKYCFSLGLYKRVVPYRAVPR